tara:strand:+ start:2528 stop:3130 length:603 start_codon:yes stop_codon:yes gene_type:complete
MSTVHHWYIKMTHYSTMPRHIVLVILAAFTLSACENARDAMGIGKKSPDEFSVVTRAPLSIPPDLGLRPPQPGAERQQEKAVTDSARELLVKSTGATTPRHGAPSTSRGEAALLANAGATNADPAIRRKLSRDSSILATEDDSFADRLIFWQDKLPPGETVDAAAEQRRLRENAGLGDAPTKGRTLKIIRKPKGWLEGIF